MQLVTDGVCGVRHGQLPLLPPRALRRALLEVGDWSQSFLPPLPAGGCDSGKVFVTA
jgi:hypothetical protein